MENKQKSMIASNKRLIGILLTVSILLLIPLIAMQFTDEVKWGSFDFLVAGILLYGAGLTFEFIMRKVRSARLRIVISLALFLVLFLVWAELAVGIFGSPISGN